jgi:hypothetical protein
MHQFNCLLNESEFCPSIACSTQIGIIDAFGYFSPYPLAKIRDSLIPLKTK